MPHLICLIQRCHLGDGRLILEGETFEVSQEVADNLTRGGRIAKLVEKPEASPRDYIGETVKARVVEKQPEPEPEPVSEPEPEPEEIPAPEPPEKIYAKPKRKR